MSHIDTYFYVSREERMEKYASLETAVGSYDRPVCPDSYLYPSFKHVQ